MSNISVLFLVFFFLSGIPPGEKCQELGVCVVNAECSSQSGGLCQCLPEFYKEGKTCLPLKNPSQQCSSAKECVPNANCTEDSGVNVCMCNTGFYDNSGRCERSIKPGKPCTGLGQCVPHAECTSEVGGVCQCDKG